MNTEEVWLPISGYEGFYTVSNLGRIKRWSILNENTVIQIRDMYSTGKYTQRDIARLFNIKYKHVNKIIHRLIWNHV